MEHYLKAHSGVSKKRSSCADGPLHQQSSSAQDGHREHRDSGLMLLLACPGAGSSLTDAD